jgi:hypothetical protein
MKNVLVPGGIDKIGSIGAISLGGSEMSKASDNSKLIKSKTMKAQSNVGQDPGTIIKVAAPVEPSMLDSEFDEIDMNMSKAGTLVVG